MDTQRFQQMIELARNGDEEAGDYLFFMSHEPLRGMVMGIMDPVLQGAGLEPEDIIQEAYAAAWPKIPEGDFPNFAAFRGWLSKIARNKAIDLRRAAMAAKNDIRREVCQPAAPTSSYDNLVDRIAASDTTPSRCVRRGEALAMLSGQMWRLPEDYRRIIQWRMIQGLPVAEVAQRLGKSEAAVHMLCHRALKKLKQLMGSPSKYLSTA